MNEDFVIPPPIEDPAEAKRIIRIGPHPKGFRQADGTILQANRHERRKAWSLERKSR